MDKQSATLSPYSRDGDGDGIPRAKTLLDAGYYHINHRDVPRSDETIILRPHNSDRTDIEHITELRSQAELAGHEEDSAKLRQKLAPARTEGDVANEEQSRQDEKALQVDADRAMSEVHSRNPKDAEIHARNTEGDIAYMIRLKPGVDIPDKWKSPTPYSTFTTGPEGARHGDETQQEQNCILIFPDDAPAEVNPDDWDFIDKIETLDLTPELEELGTLEHVLEHYGDKAGRVSIWVGNLGMPAESDVYVDRFIPKIYRNMLEEAQEKRLHELAKSSIEAVQGERLDATVQSQRLLTAMRDKGTDITAEAERLVEAIRQNDELDEDGQTRRLLQAIRGEELGDNIQARRMLQAIQGEGLERVVENERFLETLHNAGLKDTVQAKRLLLKTINGEDLLQTMQSEGVNEVVQARILLVIATRWFAEAQDRDPQSKGLDKQAAKLQNPHGERLLEIAKRTLEGAPGEDRTEQARKLREAVQGVPYTQVRALLKIVPVERVLQIAQKSQEEEQTRKVLEVTKSLIETTQGTGLDADRQAERLLADGQARNLIKTLQGKGLDKPIVITERSSRNRGVGLVRSYLDDIANPDKAKAKERRAGNTYAAAKTVAEIIFDRTNAIFGERKRPAPGEIAGCSNGALVISAPSLFKISVLDKKNVSPDALADSGAIAGITRYLHRDGKETDRYVAACAVEDAGHIGSCLEAEGGFEHIISAFDLGSDTYTIRKAREGAAIYALLGRKNRIGRNNREEPNFRYTVVPLGSPVVDPDNPPVWGSKDFQTQWPLFTKEYKSFLERHNGLNAIDIEVITSIQDMTSNLEQLVKQNLVPEDIYAASGLKGGGFRVRQLRVNLRDQLGSHIPIAADFDGGGLTEAGFTEATQQLVRVACDAIYVQTMTKYGIPLNEEGYLGFLEEHGLNTPREMAFLNKNHAANADLVLLNEYGLLDDSRLPRGPLTYQETMKLVKGEEMSITPLWDGLQRHVSSLEEEEAARKSRADDTSASPSRTLTIGKNAAVVHLPDSPAAPPL